MTFSLMNAKGLDRLIIYYPRNTYLQILLMLIVKERFEN